MTEATAKRVVSGVDELRELVGQEIGVTEWREVTQENINKFADATGDHQWIHVDPERAAKESPFKTTIAHGFYTVSLIPVLVWQLFEVQNVAVYINYGMDKMRFPAPVPVGSKIRMRLTIGEVTEVAGGVQAAYDCTFEREGGDKPVCVARHVSRMYTS